jgi:D-xylose reductase
LTTNDLTRIALADGSLLPSIGLGLWKIDPTQTAGIVQAAIQCGYRHIDAACDYGNEAQAGEGIQRAIQSGLCQRDQLWITSKLWNTYHRPEHVRPAIKRTLTDLRLDYLDLYLIHFPIALRYIPFDRRYPPGWIFDPDSAAPRMYPDQVPLVETWQAMEELQNSGLCKQIGVCNFGVSLIRDLLSYAKIPPAVLQVESHPYLVQPKLLRFCQEQQIAFTAFSPLGAGSYIPLGMAQATDSVLQHPLIRQLAAQYGKTPAQIALRWGIQRGTAVIPKTSQPARLVENLNLFDFHLTDQEINQISGLDTHRRFNDPGVFCEQAFGCYFPIYE